ALVGLYIISMIVGAAIHEHGVTLPGSEILVAASLLALGVAMQFRLLTGIAAALFAAAGFVKGDALGETIAGAEPSPLLFYFAGLVAIQMIVALAVIKLVRLFLVPARTPVTLRTRGVGAAAIAVGAVLLLVDLLPRA
ncbi:MAG: HupE/UreJ family protein, partial [Xanthobacteraceae bacterium]